MVDETGQALEEVVRPVFPAQAQIRTRKAHGGYRICAAWRLGNNPMDNWSKEIQVVIPEEAAERYAKLNERGREKADANLVAFVEKHLAAFRPEHDRPRFLLPPVERWEVAFEELFPKK